MKGFKPQDMDDKEIKHQLSEMEDQFFRLKFQKGMGQLEGLKKLRTLRKDRARALTVLRHAHLRTISAVDRGLRDGILADLLRRNAGEPEGRLAESALSFARRFRTSHAHAEHVSQLALSLFDALGTVHRLVPATRRLLEAAAILHDVGHAVNPQRHHKHAQYIIRNGDIAGLTDKERAEKNELRRRANLGIAISLFSMAVGLAGLLVALLK